MATLTTSATQSVDFRNLELYPDYEDAVISNQSSTGFTATFAPGNFINVVGVGFDYFQGYPYTGTLKEVTFFAQNSVRYKLSDISVTIGQAYEYSQQDPQTVLADVFKGIDKVTGSNLGDYINGFGGADTLTGLAGNDTYVIDNAGDRVIEKADAGSTTFGVDTILSSVSHTIEANVENMTLTGSADINGTGNSAANVITGNGGKNILSGGGGTDRMVGGLGDDTYITDGGDNIVETSATGGGNDTVKTSASITLNANIENLVLTGTANIFGAGNTSNNSIVGNSGNNILTGYGGSDQINGGLGMDTFVFRSLSDSAVDPTGRDLIRDFNQSQGDRINLGLIDANASTTANDAFTFVGSAAFSGTAGELRTETAGVYTTVSGDVNGDAVADFAILVNKTTFVQGDFVL